MNQDKNHESGHNPIFLAQIWTVENPLSNEMEDVTLSQPVTPKTL